MLTYVDSSVLLAWVLSEDRAPPTAFGDRDLVSSKLLDYEVWNRIHARDAAALLGERAEAALDSVVRLALEPVNLERALLPFPATVRTLDALHLATLDSLRVRGTSIELATYDRRMSGAAALMGFALCPL